MKTTHSRLFAFETCSVVLFAALSIGAVTAAHAQTAQGSPTQPAFGPAAATPAAPSKFTIGPAAAPKGADQSAFDQADTDHNGKLSRKEAAAQGLSSQKFQQWDKNQDGSLSRDEFDQGGQ